MGKITTWRKEITAEPESRGQGWYAIEATTLSESDLDEEFSVGWGSVSGRAFTAWTADRVYFPICYDGAEWVGSVPRNPCDEACQHQGGG